MTMNLQHRLRLAWNILRGSAEVRTGRKDAPFSFRVGMGSARWSLADAQDRGQLQKYVDEGYSFNALIYAPISYKARNMSSVPFWAAKGDLDNPEWLADSDPLAKVLARPNRWQSRRTFQAQRVTYLNLAGNSYTFVDRKAGKPVALYNLRPDRVWILPKTDGIQGYYYVPTGARREDGVPILPEDMIHVKYPNPRDEHEGFGYGLPPLLSAARSADVDNRATTLLNRLFESGAMPMGIVKSSLKLDEEDVARIRKVWQERYGGVENWTDIAVLDADADYRRAGLTFEEMGFETLDERTEARILMVFGVPPILLGTRMGLARSTYSNYEEARRQCWEDTLLPELMMFEDADNAILGAPSGTFIVYDTASIPALRQDIDKQIEGARKLFEMGVPTNLALATVGLKLNVPGGDTGYIANSIVPVGGESQTPPQVEEAAKSAALPVVPKVVASVAEITAARGQWTPEQKVVLWKGLDDLAVSHEVGFKKMAAEQFELDRREILALASEAKAKALRRKATIDWQPVLDEALDVIKASGERWREAFIPQVRGVVSDVAEFWQVEAGLAFDVTRLEDQRFFTDYAMDFWDQISKTSRDEIGGVIQNGLKQGWSIEEMQNGLDSVFRQWISGDGDAEMQRFAAGRLQPWRTEMIARTESTKATSWASWRVYQEAGVKKKEWLNTQDSRTRDSHKDESQGGVGGQIRDIDQAFDLPGGAKMMHPGDGSLGAPVAEIVYCRCGVLPIIEDEGP